MLGSGGIQRDHGKTRLIIPQRKSIMDIDEEDGSTHSPDGSTKSPGGLEITMQSLQRPTVNPDFVKNLQVLSPVKAARLESVQKFIRHATATFVLMISSSQILYAYICGMLRGAGITSE
jgi:hypothetical protein